MVETEMFFFILKIRFCTDKEKLRTYGAIKPTAIKVGERSFFTSFQVLKQKPFVRERKAPLPSYELSETK